MKKVILAMAIMMTASTVFAGECKIKIKRDSCPGKEAEAYKPYDGKIETEETKNVANEAACKTWADKSAKIVRKGTLSAKHVTPMFEGKTLSLSEDAKACK